MRWHLFILAVFVAGSVLLMQVGCREETRPALEGRFKAPPEVEKEGPSIKFAKVVHDFGEVGPRTSSTCEFKFTNTGNRLLKVEPVQTCCGVRARLDKKDGEYAPGESGIVKVTYNSDKRLGSTMKPLFVHSNDKTRPSVKLTIYAKIAAKVAYKPKQLRLLLEDSSADCPEIELVSLDGQPFAIESFRATAGGIIADYDSSVKAKKHIIQPKIHIEALQKHIRGHIEIKLTHPGCRKVTIPFDVLPIFQIDPSSIIVFNAEPEKPIKRVLWVANNLGEDFEVESASSENGLVSVLSRERIENLCKFELEIMPPADASKKRFEDVFHINIKDGKKLSIRCRGFYSKNKENP